MKSVKIFLAILVAGIIFSACNKDEETMAFGSLSVKMTDAPGDYLEVNVEVDSVLVHLTPDDNAAEAWVTLNAKAGVYDLLELQNGVTALLADKETVPVGKISQMRLILGDTNYVVLAVDSSRVDLNLSSQDETGLKFLVNADIEKDKETEILFDFDAGKSIIETGNGALKLKPVIQDVEVSYK